ncbi:hypothetical protein V6N11_027882 [Hibiscus sabdariffa]|uniref:Uncharacterized protein n=1 Tax=Hibiscus sabdariffa TaxID=183260 RepID=A0ABR2NZH5_9ROSI
MLRRNGRNFDPDCTQLELILSQGKRLQQECRAVVAAGRQPGCEPTLPQNQIRWERPPMDWCKLNTNEQSLHAGPVNSTRPTRN